jgi:SAM-dependent methyltransferase
MLFSDPTTRGLDLDDPKLTEQRRTILKQKVFLHSIYLEWYKKLIDTLPSGQGACVELGSGAGFITDLVPELITTEILWSPNAKVILDGCVLPFADQSLKAVVMVDVLHHIPSPRNFLSEATRCLKPGGVVSMVEPWVTPWSEWVYKNLHHELFDPEAKAWEFKSSGPLSGANGALPWIIFARDNGIFVHEFPDLYIDVIHPMMPFSYLVSGGLSMRGLAPGWSYSGWRRLERAIENWMPRTAMFALIILRRGTSDVSRN